MGSDDFINIEPVIGSNEEDDGSALGEDGEIKEGEHEQDMDLESDPEISFVKGKKLPESMVTEEAHENVQLEKISENASAVLISEVNINNQSKKGVKRARTTNEDQQPCVHVSYKSLTKEGKKKLIELMQQWSRWHAESKSSKVSSEENLECGTETFFPALHVGLEKTSVSFWVDNQVRNEDVESIQLDNDLVPLYDRGYTLGSTSQGGSADSERIETFEASRCFNCGSYSHSLKECPKPRDIAAVNNARKQHNSNRKSTPPSGGQTRYYLEPKGKFHDLKPGILGPETREALGIGKLDPPPWLNKMRQLGYPPGYLDEVEDADGPSGITIFGEEEVPKVEYEDGELPEKADPIPAEKKTTVKFPGINAPIPENADRFLWETHAYSSKSWEHYDKSSWLVDRFKDQRANDGPQRGHHYRDVGQPAPPGTEHGYSYSSRYSSSSHYDISSSNNNNSSHGSQSLSLGRSLSDRGWHSSADDIGGSRHRLSSSGNNDHDQPHNDRWRHRS